MTHQLQACQVAPKPLQPPLQPHPEAILVGYVGTSQLFVSTLSALSELESNAAALPAVPLLLGVAIATVS